MRGKEGYIEQVALLYMAAEGLEMLGWLGRRRRVISHQIETLSYTGVGGASWVIRKRCLTERAYEGASWVIKGAWMGCTSKGVALWIG